MNVVVVTSSYPLRPGDGAAAAGLFVRDFASEAVRQGHTVRVMTQSRAGEQNDDPAFPVIRFPWRGDRPLSTLRPTRPSDLLAMWSLFTNGFRVLDELILRHRPDLVIAMWAVPAGLLARRVFRRRGVPYRVWALGSDIWDYGRNRWTRGLVRGVLRDAERLYADGLALTEEVERLASRPCAFLASSRLLPSGTDPPAAFDPDHTNFVFVGRFHPNKGVDLLIEAIAGLSPRERDSCRFFLFGDGPLEARVEGEIATRDLGRSVRLMGFGERETVAAFLEHGHALVIPSRIESIPVVLSDAAQAGCPILATRVGDMGRLLDETRAGIVVEPTAASIAEGIQSMARSSRADFGPGLRTLAERFSLEESVRRILEP